MGKIYTNPNQILLSEIIVIYETYVIDWLSYQITKRNKLTLHHVEKEADGGKLSINNAAPLTIRGHQGLNKCESRDFILYSEINDFFKKIIAHGVPLDDYMLRESREYKQALQRVLYKNGGF